MLGALLFLVAAARGYAGPDDRWISGLLPEALRRQGPFELLWWQWLALPALTLLAFAFGRLLSRASQAALRVIFQRTDTEWDDRLLLEVAPALSVAWSVLVAAAVLPALAFGPSMERTVRSLLAVGLILAVIWALWRSVSVVCEVLLTRRQVNHPSWARSLVGVGAVLVRTLIIVFGIFAVAAAFGYRLNTALAGLGIGGIAIALGAQKTLENLFGSLSIAIDQPFHVDDLVTVDGITGTVERLGFRSTRIRTADRTVVTIPNGKLADMRIETLAARDRRRFALTLSLADSSTSAQTTKVIEGVKRVLRSHPRVWPERIIVSLAGMGAYAWDIEIMVWFETADDIEFRGFRDEVLLAFMEVVQEAGTSVAVQPRRVQFVTGQIV